MNERLRPKGFPVTEDELRDIKTLNIYEILEGRHDETYSRWLLRGSYREPFYPTAVLAVFPVLAATAEKFVYESDVIIEDDTQERRDAYWIETTRLSLPRRILALEAQKYQGKPLKADVKLIRVRPWLMRQVLPSAMIVFSESTKSQQESAYLFCPNLVPPSTAFRQLISQAQRELRFQ